MTDNSDNINISSDIVSTKVIKKYRSKTFLHFITLGFPIEFDDNKGTLIQDNATKLLKLYNQFFKDSVVKTYITENKEKSEQNSIKSIAYYKKLEQGYINKILHLHIVIQIKYIGNIRFDVNRYLDDITTAAKEPLIVHRTIYYASYKTMDSYIKDRKDIIMKEDSGYMCQSENNKTNNYKRYKPRFTDSTVPEISGPNELGVKSNIKTSKQATIKYIVENKEKEEDKKIIPKKVEVKEKEKDKITKDEDTNSKVEETTNQLENTNLDNNEQKPFSIS